MDYQSLKLAKKYKLETTVWSVKYKGYTSFYLPCGDRVSALYRATDKTILIDRGLELTQFELDGVYMDELQDE